MLKRLLLVPRSLGQQHLMMTELYARAGGLTQLPLCGAEHAKHPGEGRAQAAGRLLAQAVQAANHGLHSRAPLILRSALHRLGPTDEVRQCCLLDSCITCSLKAFRPLDIIAHVCEVPAVCQVQRCWSAVACCLQCHRECVKDEPWFCSAAFLLE